LRKRIAFIAAALVAFSAPLIVFGDEMPSAAPTAASEKPLTAAGDAALDAIATAYYQEEWKFRPVDATDTGVHTYDDQLGPVTPEAFAARDESLRATLQKLQGLDRSTLSLNGQTDQQILEDAIQEHLFWDNQWPDWRRRPSYYSDIASDGVYTIMSRNFAPIDQRLRSVIAREKQIPAMLAQGEKNLDPATTSAVVATIGQFDAQGAVDFLSHDVPAVFGKVGDQTLQAQFAAANDAARDALASYEAYVKSTVIPNAHGTYAIGSANYDLLERLQNVADIPLARLLQIGEADLSKNQAEFVATARKIDATKNPQQILAQIQTDHPANDQLIGDAQGDLDQLVSFIKQNDIIDLPQAPIARARPTPQFQAQTSFASMNSPGPLETKATEAYYNVTLADPDWPKAQVQQHLEFYNQPSLVIVSAHETYPGHYTNYLFSKERDLSLIRKIEWNNAMGEGWAHYDEQMMVDEGLGGGDPRYRLVQLMLALQRDCRYIVGIKEHTAGMTIDQATEFFMANAYMGQEPSRREALRGTVDPLYGYYTLGKLMLLKLRADYKTQQGSAFKLNQFHDAVLSHGDPPIYFLRKFILGANDSGSLL